MTESQKNNENVTELTPKQLQALRSLLTKPSVNEAAKDAGVNARTIYRWLELPEFRKALTQAEDQAIDAATRGLISLTEKSILVLNSVLDADVMQPSTKLRAVELALSNLLKLVELRNLSERIAALEAQNAK